MSKRISKRVRDEAALICSAESCRLDSEFLRADFAVTCRSMGADCFDMQGPAELARKAYWHVIDETALVDTESHAWAVRIPTLKECEQWAEAEALLRTGWTP